MAVYSALFVGQLVPAKEENENIKYHFFSAPNIKAIVAQLDPAAEIN